MEVDSLLQAAGNGQLDEIQKCLAEGVDVNVRNTDGYTALMSAARSYRVEIVRYLLSVGADPNSTFEDGNSVLHAAVGESPSQPEAQAECVGLLLRSGADPNSANELGITPLINAAWFGCELCARELVDAGADVSHSDAQGRTALSIAEERGHERVVAVLA